MKRQGILPRMPCCFSIPETVASRSHPNRPQDAYVVKPGTLHETSSLALKRAKALHTLVKTRRHAFSSPKGDMAQTAGGRNAIVFPE